MLVLTRRVGESIEVKHRESGEVLIVKFLAQKTGTQALIGFEGSKFSILRMEVKQRDDLKKAAQT